MHFLSYLLIYIISIIVTKIINTSNKLLVMYDLAKKKYKLSNQEFILEMISTNKRDYIPIYNMFNALNNLSFYTINKETFLYSLIKKGNNLIEMNNDDYKDFIKNPSLKKVFLMHFNSILKNNNDNNIENKKVSIERFNKYLIDLSSYISLMNISKKVFFTFETDVTKYYFCIDNNVLYLINYEFKEKVFNSYSPLDSKDFCDYLKDTLTELFKFYIVNKDDILSKINFNEYLVDNDYIDLGDIVELLYKYSNISKKKNIKKKVK